MIKSYNILDWRIIFLMEEKNVTISVIVPESYKEKLKKIAKEQDVNMSWVIRKILKEKLEEN